MAMFSSLSEKIRGAVGQLSGKGKVRREDLEATIRKIKLSLLEADVHFRVVQQFIDGLSERLLGMKLLPTLNPEQQILGSLETWLEEFLGQPPELDFSRTLLLGLQGSGKTTTAAKLAGWLDRQSQKPLLVPADVARPAAIEQLNRLGEKLNIEVFPVESGWKPAKICKRAMASNHQGPVLVDSAGRLQIDKPLMKELADIIKVVKPTCTLLVVDAMIGQEALTIAKEFHEQCGLDALIFTKMDGDARGGSALSIRSITGLPIAFLGVGEGLEQIEAFDPKRLANRILGMGDMGGLMERAQRAIDNESAIEVEDVENFREFSLEAFLQMNRMLKKMGPLQEVLGMVPGFSKVSKGLDMDKAKQSMQQFEAMVLSMTPLERQKPKVLDASRRRRVAKGSGTSLPEVNRFLKQYSAMKKMMKKGGPQGLMKGMMGK